MNEEKLFFDSGYGLKLCGILANPTGNLDRVVILVHGFSSDKNGSSSTALYKELTKRNIASFRIDLNGLGESEGDFAETTITKMVKDTGAAIEFMKKKGFNLIHLSGSSCGGPTCMATVKAHPEVTSLFLQCPVSDYPQKNLSTYGAAFMNEWKERGYRDYDSGKKGILRVNYSFVEDYQQYVMYDQVEDIVIPVLIVHGTKDKVVSIEQSRKLANCFPNAKLVEIEGAGHDMKVNGDRNETDKLFGEFFSMGEFP